MSMGRVQDSTVEASKVPAEQRNCQGDPEMAAQEEKSRKNAKERRKKKKAAGALKSLFPFVLIKVEPLPPRQREVCRSVLSATGAVSLLRLDACLGPASPN